MLLDARLLGGTSDAQLVLSHSDSVATISKRLKPEIERRLRVNSSHLLSPALRVLAQNYGREIGSEKDGMLMRVKEGKKWSPFDHRASGL